MPSSIVWSVYHTPVWDLIRIPIMLTNLFEWETVRNWRKKQIVFALWLWRRVLGSLQPRIRNPWNSQARWWVGRTNPLPTSSTLASGQRSESLKAIVCFQISFELLLEYNPHKYVHGIFNVLYYFFYKACDLLEAFVYYHSDNDTIFRQFLPTNTKSTVYHPIWWVTNLLQSVTIMKWTDYDKARFRVFRLHRIY